MKNFFMLILLVLLVSCGGGKKKLFMPDSTRWTDQDVPLDELPQGNVNTDSVTTADAMKQLFSPGDSLVEGRPVSFYLNRRDISQTARDFYLLRFLPSSFPPANALTHSLADSLLSGNDTTRPFYYFLFLRLHKLEDNTGFDYDLAGYGKEYAMNFVDEFYYRLGLPVYRFSYDCWVSDVAESNLHNSPDDYKQLIITTQSKNAKKLTAALKQKIIGFADSVAVNLGGQ